MGEGVVYCTPIESRTDALTIAFVELDFPMGARDDLAADLARDPAVFTVNRTGAGFIATVVAETPTALGGWAPPAAAASSSRAILITELVADARGWQLRALGGLEQQSLLSHRSSGSARPVLDSDDRHRLAAALVDDVRAPAAVLGRRIERSPRAVSATLDWMLAAGELAIRIDVSRSCTSWPVEVWFFLRAPGPTLTSAAKRLKSLPELRVVATTSGRCNLVLAAWLRSLGEVTKLEGVLTQNLPGVEVLDSGVVLRTDKHVGHLLDSHGFATGEIVPLSPVAG